VAWRKLQTGHFEIEPPGEFITNIADGAFRMLNASGRAFVIRDPDGYYVAVNETR